MSKQSVRLLLAEADRAALTPVLDALRAKGVAVAEGKGSAGDTILAVLSEHFYADSSLKDALLGAIGGGAENVLPLQMDSAEIPDDLKNALYARNIISMGERDANLIADRIIDALPVQKSRLPIMLLAGGAVLVALIGFMVAQGMKAPAPESVEETVAEAPKEIPYPLPAGLTEEDLAEIRCVAIMGDHFKYYTERDRRMQTGELMGMVSWNEWFEDLCNESADENSTDRRWFWKEDGSELNMASYDLRFLSLMPNLEELQLVQVEVTDAPDLSGLEKLSALYAMDCNIGDISWIVNSNVQKVKLRCDSAYSRLGECEHLQFAELWARGGAMADLSSFAPPRLRVLLLRGDGGAAPGNLSGLSSCSMLQTLTMDGIPIRDLSFLADKRVLEHLEMNWMQELSDISAIRNLSGLKILRIDQCRNIQDYSPIGGCSVLERLMISAGDDRRLQDASFLGGLKKLDEISLFDIDLQNLDFLRQLSEGKSLLMRLELGGNVADYSGLESFDTYSTLHVNMYNRGSADQIAPYLEGKKINDLNLANLDQVDLSQLPQPTQRLELANCGISDLTSVPDEWAVKRLSLRNCMLLRSLEGLGGSPEGGSDGSSEESGEAADGESGRKSGGGSGFGTGGTLEIYNCPRLSDWDALEGMNLKELTITGGFTMPDLGTFHTEALRLDSVAEVNDLSFLDDMDTSRKCSFKLVGLEGVNNLKPLERFHGMELTVSPELEEQARDLVKSGNFSRYMIEYPEGGWDQNNNEFSLLSLDELETLPDAMLRHVGTFGLVRDTLFDANRSDVWRNWDENGMHFVVHDFDTNETTPVEGGEGIVSDIDFIGKLTGLRRLSLVDQPIESVDGIQNFGELEFLTLNNCEDLTDISPVFTLQNLRYLSLDSLPIDSIQGVQNLPYLWELKIGETRVTDLSPLAECDFSMGIAEQGGFGLALNDLSIDDYSPLTSIPSFNYFESGNTDPADYIPYLSGSKVRCYRAHNSFTEERCSADDINGLFAEFCEAHPELEEIAVPWNEDLTDLRPLLSMENLREVRVSNNMEEALASLDGEDVRFHVEVEGQ